jgi:hypothetical protein
MAVCLLQILTWKSVVEVIKVASALAIPAQQFPQISNFFFKFLFIVEEPLKYVSICSLRKHEEFGGTLVSTK